MLFIPSNPWGPIRSLPNKKITKKETNLWNQLCVVGWLKVHSSSILFWMYRNNPCTKINALICSPPLPGCYHHVLIVEMVCSRWFAAFFFSAAHIILHACRETSSHLLWNHLKLTSCIFFSSATFLANTGPGFVWKMCLIWLYDLKKSWKLLLQILKIMRTQIFNWNVQKNIEFLRVVNRFAFILVSLQSTYCNDGKIPVYCTALLQINTDAEIPAGLQFLPFFC